MVLKMSCLSFEIFIFVYYIEREVELIKFGVHYPCTMKEHLYFLVFLTHDWWLYTFLEEMFNTYIIFLTKKHSSRMRIARLPPYVFRWPPLGVDRILDTPLWKHYLPQTKLREDNAFCRVFLWRFAFDINAFFYSLFCTIGVGVTPTKAFQRQTIVNGLVPVTDMYYWIYMYY